MRFIIYGTGAIGGVVGGQLALAGNEVVFIGRPAQVEAIKHNGLHLVTATQTHILKTSAVISPEQIHFRPDDVVFLSVKSQDTTSVLECLKEVVHDIPIFCFQNGVHNEEAAAQYFSRVYGVRVRIGGIFVTNGEIVARTIPVGCPIMGRYPSGTDRLLETVAEMLRKAGFLILITPDIMPYKWGQLVGNLANVVSAITNTSEDEGKNIITAAREEGLDILKQAGIRWISEAEIAQDWPEGADIQHLPNTRYQNSTWQSLTRQQGTVETRYFNGEIVRVAERIGKRAPINETLVRLAEEMAAKRELPGKYTVNGLAKLLGIAKK